MMINSIIRNLFADNISLNEYMHGKVPSFKDVERRLLLLLRKENTTIPDHYYRLNQKFSLKGIDSVSSLLTKGLYKLADEHLEIINDRIYVKQSMQNSWQELITYMPPLILQMAFLSIKKPLCINTGISEIREYCIKTILPNVRYTALPHPYIPEIEHLAKKQNGFHDLHIHLNGSTETDVVWQDLILNPQKVVKFCNESINKNSLAKEQIEEDFEPINTINLEQLLLIARRIRQYLFKLLFNVKSCDKENDILNAKSTSEVIARLGNDDDELNDSIDNPFTDIIMTNGKKHETPLYIEGLMYVLVICYLKDRPKESVAAAFHFYLLILGLFNRLLVQQKHDYGFEEFQKYTVNGIREHCEINDYKTRFLQLCGNNVNNIAFIEGRFSPKLNQKDNEQLIFNITRGWESCWNNIKCLLDCECKQTPELRLIAHFIKNKDNNSSLIRHEKLRKEVWEKARVLALMKNNNSPSAKHIVGIDAAASEFDAPPEVFAPAFRHLKRKGFKHFTYHAGEDFYHILDGLRRIYEAVDFLNLSYGDRIGHATAAGVSPKVWKENVGEVIYMYKGEYLDDLVFAYYLITTHSYEKLRHTATNLAIKIRELYYSIYKDPCSVELICDVWKLRKLCPLHVFAKNKADAQYLQSYDNEEWCEVFSNLNIKDKNCNCGLEVDNDNKKIVMLQQYHCPEFRNKYDEIIAVNVNEIFSDTDLEELQLMILGLLNEKEIIIETLPTSNVRIGHHHTYDTYHLWNWIKWEKEGKQIPPIVVGTDDPGIFATNIYNEYSNIYCSLVHIHKMSRNQAMEIIEKLDKNAQIYKFT